MLQVKNLKGDYRDTADSATATVVASQGEAELFDSSTPTVPMNSAVSDTASQHKSNRPAFPVISQTTSQDFQTRVPVIIGEATFRGSIPVDGIIVGQLGGSSGTLGLRQRGRLSGAEPELSGDISFRDMLRVNGHIAGTVQSKKGTLIVDLNARIDGDIEVSIAVIAGTVNGDIVAQQRVEVASTARIYGNIWTRSLAIQRGAIFEGVCQMLEGSADG